MPDLVQYTPVKQSKETAFSSEASSRRRARSRPCHSTHTSRRRRWPRPCRQAPSSRRVERSVPLDAVVKEEERSEGRAKRQKSK